MVVPATARGYLHTVLRVLPVVGLTRVPIGVVPHRSAVGPHVGALGALVVQTNPRSRASSQVQDLGINVTGIDRRQHAAKSFAGSLGVIAAEAVLIVVVACPVDLGASSAAIELYV